MIVVEGLSAVEKTTLLELVPADCVVEVRRFYRGRPVQVRWDRYRKRWSQTLGAQSGCWRRRRGTGAHTRGVIP